MSHAIVIKQPAALNHLVDANFPRTWEKRLNPLRAVTPLLIVSSVFLLEVSVLALWRQDRLSLADLPELLGLACLPFVLVPLAVELQFFLVERSMRVLDLRPKKIIISHSKFRFVQWDRVSFHLQAVRDHPGFLKLTLRYSAGSRGRIQRQWSILLQHPAQTTLLRQTLNDFGYSALLSPETQDEPAPAFPPKHPRLRGLWLLALGCLLFVHGFPLLAVGLSGFQPHEAGAPLAQHRVQFYQHAFQFFHIHNLKQLRMLFLVSGALFSASGAVCYIAALRQIKTPRESS